MAASVPEPRPSTAAALSGSGVIGSRQHFNRAGLRLVERGRLVVLCFTLLWVSLASMQGSGMHRSRYTALLGLASEGTPERGLAPPFESAGSESPSGGKCCEGASKGCRHSLCFPIWKPPVSSLWLSSTRKRISAVVCVAPSPTSPGVTNLATLSCCSECWGELV